MCLDGIVTKLRVVFARKVLARFLRDVVRLVLPEAFAFPVASDLSVLTAEARRLCFRHQYPSHSSTPQRFASSTAARVIERSAFSECTALTTIRIPEGVVKLGAYAFSDCTNLKRIYLSSSVSIFEEYVFLDCKALTEVYLDGNVKKWEVMNSHSIQSYPKFTVYCNNGEIAPDGTVTMYE